MLWFVAPFAAGYLAGNWVQEKVDIACKMEAGSLPQRRIPTRNYTMAGTAKHVKSAAVRKGPQGFTLQELGELFGRERLASVVSNELQQFLLGRALIEGPATDARGVVPIEACRSAVQEVWVASGGRENMIFAIGNKQEGYRNLVFKKLAGRYYPRNSKGVPVKRSEAMKFLAEMYRIMDAHKDRMRSRIFANREGKELPAIRLMD